MALAYRKEFQQAGFERFDAMVAVVWAKFLDDDQHIIIASELRDGLSDERPQEDHEPCRWWHHSPDGSTVLASGEGSDPLDTLTKAMAHLSVSNTPTEGGES